MKKCNLTLEMFMRNFLYIFIFIFLSFFILPNISEAATSVSQYGITWTFDKNYTVGQFINGDYWVLDPGDGVKVVDISPGYTTHPTTGRAMNGSMINPATALQGYDGFMSYSADKNVGIGITQINPLILSGDKSLVSTISNDSCGDLGGGNHVSYVKTAAVLTSLVNIPSEGSFRPGISAETKTLHNFNDIDFSKLKSLPSPITKIDINIYAGYFQMVWLDHNGGWTTRYMHPSDSGLGNYYFPLTFSTVALMLHLDYSNQEKEALLRNFIQFGIDIYSYIESGAKGWGPDGGHSNGRKWPILFAGLMLDYAPMKNIGQKSGDYLYFEDYGPGNIPPDYIHFGGEDGQTFYVEQLDVDITNSPSWNPDVRSAPNYPYTELMLGMPEWGIRHSTSPAQSDSAWNANYRTIMSGPSSWAGTSVAARIMNAKELWNNNAHFDYVDRYMAISKGDPDPFGYIVSGEGVGSRPGGLIGAMWDTYRDDFYPTVGPSNPIGLSVL